MKTILKKAKRTLALFLVLLMVVPMTILLAVPVSAASVKYEVEGGYIYFDPSTGTITDCDESVTKADIPSQINGVSVMSITWYAFYDCFSLTSITIPNSLTKFGDPTFGGCPSLESIKVDENNKNYCDIDGVFFNKNKTELIYYPVGKKNSSYVIPNDVTSIGEGAFYGCTSLESITIPNTVTSIGESAFVSCNSLTSITIPNSVTSIGNNAFSSCRSLKSINIGDGVTSIGDGAFNRCDSLESITIPNSVTDIGDSVFDYCSSLTSITIPNGVTSIGDYAFNCCESLESIKVDENNENYCDIDGVLFNKNKTELIYHPVAKKNSSYVIPNSVTSIWKGAFHWCESLESITIPNSITSIEEATFGGCTSLESITIPNSVTSIGEDAFYCCYSLTSITIPNSVTSIGYEAFNGCTSLTSITIPDSVTSIGDRAFFECNSLTSITISDSITSIGYGVFIACISLESITIPDSVTSIGDYAFLDCTSLTSITISDSITSIGYYVFERCDKLDKIYYKGSENDWNKISIGYNENFSDIEIIFLEDSSKPDEPITNPFTDVKDGKWYTEGILWCYYKGYMSGVSETVFDYKGNVTRAMFVTILAKIDGSDISGYNTMSFSDVPARQWYSNAIEWAYQNGYAAGLAEGYFGRKDNVSREQIAMFFYTYSEKNGIDVSKRANLAVFKDNSKIHRYAMDALSWAVFKGLISGTSATTLSPREPATRAEIALIVKNYVENVK